MSRKEAIARWGFIIYKLSLPDASATFKEIADYLKRKSEEDGYNYEVDERTFQRDLNEIRFLYNIDIKYSFKQKVYYIDSTGYPKIKDRLLEAFSTLHALKGALTIYDGFENSIQFENRRPQGYENLYPLLNAVKCRQRIKFSYLNFWEGETTTKLAEPYALKEFKSRWYVLAKDIKDNGIKSYALDRLSDLEVTKKHFDFPSGYNAEDSYLDYFGIINSPGEVQDITLSFDPYQGKYAKTMPLHNSQQILLDNDEELQIRLRLVVTYDFVMELLSYGDRVKVLKPKSLADEVKMKHYEAFMNY